MLNLHLTKSIHAVLVIGNPGRPPSAGPQGFALAPGAAALFEDPYPAHGGVRCQIYLVVTGPGDHADERQVRAI
ncbi:hypothetical protein [Piscinibacter defluvii]|uniref:hypothetical protein n=1 Tax=Piscinibacter defluvii TaxID=1796922 RepID=UPI000FDF0183|nr:hypothetical protein [Piscinibacter defluvii]